MNGSFTERPFELESDAAFRDAQLFDDSFGDVNVWTGDMGVMLRPLSPLGSLRMIPFLAAGAGVVHYNPAGEGRQVREASVAFDKETRFAAVDGVGLDIQPNTLSAWSWRTTTSSTRPPSESRRGWEAMTRTSMGCTTSA